MLITVSSLLREGRVKDTSFLSNILKRLLSILFTSVLFETSPHYSILILELLFIVTLSVDYTYDTDPLLLLLLLLIIVIVNDSIMISCINRMELIKFNTTQTILIVTGVTKIFVLGIIGYTSRNFVQTSED